MDLYYIYAYCAVVTRTGHLQILFTNKTAKSKKRNHLKVTEPFDPPHFLLPNEEKVTAKSVNLLPSVARKFCNI